MDDSRLDGSIEVTKSGLQKAKGLLIRDQHEKKSEFFILKVHDIDILDDIVDDLFILIKECI